MKTIILGAGAWGTALAISASRDAIAPRVVTLWARDAQQARDMQLARENRRYLPGVELPAALQIRGEDWLDLLPTLAQQDLIVVASPMAALRGMLQHLRESRVPVAWLCKGFESSAHSACGLLGHEIQLQVAPALHVGVLSGPSFAQEVALGRPSALVAASAHVAVREALVQAFHSATLRVYTSADVIGVEIGGAVKNVLAIATGLCDGLQLGLNARAAVITRGLAEMRRLGLALGAKAQTFMGLSGLGDLVLTATGDLSRNRQVGLALARGQSLQQALQSLGHVAEGVYCARAVVERAASLNVDMPIAWSIVALLDGTVHPAEAVAALMRRDPTAEIEDV